MMRNERVKEKVVRREIAKYLLAVKENVHPDTGISSYGICMIDTTTAKLQIGQFEDDDYRSKLRTLLANFEFDLVLVEKNCHSASTKAILSGILCTIPIEYLVSKRQFLTPEDAVKIASGDDYYGSSASEWPDVLKGMLDDSSVLPRPSNEWNLALSAFGALFWYLQNRLSEVDMLSLNNVDLYDENALKANSGKATATRPTFLKWEVFKTRNGNTSIELKSILNGFAIVPGGVTKMNERIVLLTSSIELYPKNEDWLRESIGYLFSLAASSSVSRKFCVLFDVGTASSNRVKTILNVFNQIDQPIPTRVFVINQNYWSNHSSHWKYKLEVIHSEEISKFIAMDQLPQCIGGKFDYDHEEWRTMRLAVDQFLSKLMTFTFQLEKIKAEEIGSEQIYDRRSAETALRRCENARKIIHGFMMDEMEREKFEITEKVSVHCSGDRYPDLLATLPVMADVILVLKKEIKFFHSYQLNVSTKFWNNRIMFLGDSEIELLNILPNSRNDHRTSLFYMLNKCSTPFGERLLYFYLTRPTCDPQSIKERQEAVKWLTSSGATSFVTTAVEMLRKIPDLDRLVQKIHTIGLKYRAEKHPDSRAVMFDTLKTNQKRISELLAAIDGFKVCNNLRQQYSNIQKDGEGCELLDDLLGNEKQKESVDENIKYFEKMFDRDAAQNNGKIVPSIGFDDAYDEAVEVVKSCEKKLEDYRKTVAKKYSCNVNYVNIGKLKYMEIAQQRKVSSSFELKGRREEFTRYSSSELEKIVRSLEDAQKNMAKLGDDATRRVFEQFGCKNDFWAETVEAFAKFDVVLALALFAKTSPFDMCMPEFVFDSKTPYLVIEKGVHPCLALTAKNKVTGATTFISNSITMGGDEAGVMLLTGPNMGGKSTLMRQTAVITILAHIGSMVPATSMRLSPVDVIFTRIGATDLIMRGELKCFIERYKADVVENCTEHSLFLADGLGRGASTSDETAIASAVLEKIADGIKCRAFFSTHYHSICNSFVGHPNVRLAHMKFDELEDRFKLKTGCSHIVRRGSW